MSFTGLMSRLLSVVLSCFDFEQNPAEYERLIYFYKKELTSDKVTNTLFMFVERHCNVVQICLMAVYMKLLQRFFKIKLA